MKKTLLYIVCGMLMIACSSKPDLELPVKRCADIPSPRASAAVFVHDNAAYVFGGRDSLNHYLNDLWRYDTSTDTWTCLGATPLSPRVNATACTEGHKAYLGLGFCGRHGQDTSYLQDWWSYDFETQQWERLADYPNYYTDRAVTFRESGRLAVGYGFNWNYRRDFFCYHISADRWDSIDVGVGKYDYPVRSFGGTGCTCAGRHFMGSGYHAGSLDWWAELVVGHEGTDGQWLRRAAIPGPTRTLAASCATERYIYLCGGVHYGGVNTTEKGLQDVRRYDPEQDRWAWVATLPEPLINHTGFAVGHKIYFGLGETVTEHINNKLYCIEE